MTIKCEFKILNQCSIIRNMSRVDLDPTITESNCQHCLECSPPMSVNRFTVCETLYRLRILSKFSIEKHGQLINAVQCTLGTGTLLHNHLKWFQTDTCNCKHHVAIMNAWGPNECDNNKEEIIGWLKEASIFMKVKFIKKAVTMILDDCIQESLQLHTKYNMHWIYNV
jgi:hypothetical protein